LQYENLSSGSTKGGRPYRLHPHINLQGVKADAMAKTEGAQGSFW